MEKILGLKHGAIENSKLLLLAVLKIFCPPVVCFGTQPISDDFIPVARCCLSTEITFKWLSDSILPLANQY